MNAAVTEYFKVWNAHDEQGIKALHAEASTLTDWDGAHGAAAALYTLAHAVSLLALRHLLCCLLLPPVAYCQP